MPLSRKDAEFIYALMISSAADEGNPTALAELRRHPHLTQLLYPQDSSSDPQERSPLEPPPNQ